MNYKVVSISLTILFFGLLVTTAILDQHKSNWVSGPVLILAGLILGIVQLIFAYVIYTTSRHKLKMILVIINCVILLFYTWGFIKFLTAIT